MKPYKNNLAVTITKRVIFAIGLMLSFTSFAEKPEKYVIGGTGPGNGIIFHLSDDGEHGLEAAQRDQGASVQWTNFSMPFVTTNAVKSGINGGQFNTARIITIQGAESDLVFNAALLCANYNGGGYGDWYMPSKYELNLMWQNLADSDGDGNSVGRRDPNNLGFFFAKLYLSSTEASFLTPWIQSFENGIQISDEDKKIFAKVRAIRAF